MASSLWRLRTLAGLLCAAAAMTPLGVAAQAPTASMPAPVPATDLPKDAIALPTTRAVGRQTDQWITLNGGRRLINVTQPTLTPFLPAPAKATGAAMIVAPGGGFVQLAIDKEGFNVARWLADHGIAAFVLKYRVRPFAEAMAERRAAPPTPESQAGAARPQARPFAPAAEDANAALHLVRSRAASFGVDPDRIGMIGFSAGGMLAVNSATAPAIDVRPAYIAAIYSPLTHQQVPADAPPLFAAIAADDDIFSPGDMGLIAAWREAKRPFELHVYEKGGHGFGVPGVEGTTTTQMMDQLYLWLQSRGLLNRPAR